MQWTNVFDDKFKSACLSGKSCIVLTPLFSQKLRSLDVLPPSEFPVTICLGRGKYGYFLEPYILFSFKLAMVNQGNETLLASKLMLLPYCYLPNP